MTHYVMLNVLMRNRMWKDQVDLSMFCGLLYQSCKKAMQQLNSPLNPPLSTHEGAAVSAT